MIYNAVCILKPIRCRIRLAWRTAINQPSKHLLVTIFCSRTAKILAPPIVVCRCNGFAGSQRGHPFAWIGGALAAPPAPGAALTTVANWRHTGKDLVWRGETYYWSKHHEFLRFLHLPARAALPIELALGAINDEERAHLRQHGWRSVPSVHLAEPGDYRAYIRASRGEFTVAKDQNIRLRSGWFSDRSACYLAAQRPVIMQDTGFGNILPTGAGLFAFTTEQEALAAIDMVAHDYARQSAAARDIAQEFFAAEHVLGNMLRHIGLL